MSKGKDDLIEQMKEMISKPGGKQMARFVLNSLGGFIPHVGGAIAAVGTIWSEKEQQKFNEVITEWASKTDEEFEDVLFKVNELLAKPTKPRLILLLGELFGDNIANELLLKSSTTIPVILNNESVNELQPFVNEGWIKLTATGTVCLMGSGNKVGNQIEEIKRPWGMGSGFDLVTEEKLFT
jgi:hypothetical protein